MKRQLLFCFLLFFSFRAIAQDFNYLKKITPPNIDSARVAQDWFGFRTGIDGDYAIIGAVGQDYDSAGGNYKGSAGAAYIFERNNDVWELVKKLTPPDTNNARMTDDQFGVSVGISGNYAVVGSNVQDWDSTGENYKASAGAVYVFERNNGTWNYVKKLTPSNTDSARVSSDVFGRSVSISGNYIIVGATSQDWDSAGENFKAAAGAAYIFERNNGVWGLVKKLTPPNTDSARVAQDNFGVSVGISGNYAIVGANLQDRDSSGGNVSSNAGAAYIFERNNGVWGYVKKLTPPNVNNARVGNDQFGCAVSIDNNFAIVGANFQDWDSVGGNFKTAAGAAYIFERTNDSWRYIKKLTPPNTDSARVANDQFGVSVSISNNRAIVGANFQDWDSLGGNFKSDAGAAYIFERNNGVWHYVKKLTPPDTNNSRSADDNLGISVAISGNNALIGAYQQSWDFAGENYKNLANQGAGAAYIFEISHNYLLHSNSWVAREITNDAFVSSYNNTINISTVKPGIYAVEVYDLLGRVIQPETTLETGAGWPQTLTINGITSGYYLVKIKGKDIYKTVKVYLK